MNPEDLSKMPKLLASNALLGYAAKLDVARQLGLRPLSQAQEIAGRLQGSGAALSSATAALRLIEKDRERFEEMRRVVDPMTRFQEQFRTLSWAEKISAQASAYQPMLDRIAQLGSVASVVDEMRSKVSDHYAEMHRKAVDDLPGLRALDAIRLASDMAHKRQASSAILGALSSIDSIKSNFEKLTRSSPVWAQAAELVSSLEAVSVDMLGASASNDDAQVDVVAEASDLPSTAPHRPSPDLIALASLILSFITLLFAIQQAISGGRGQAEQTEIGRQQLKALQSMQAILEKSAREEERRQHQIFVVKDRPALVRSSPYGRSVVLTKLEPGQEVKPIGEQGKWVEIEHFDRLADSYQAGWVLKKYLMRLSRSSRPSDDVSQ